MAKKKIGKSVENFVGDTRERVKNLQKELEIERSKTERLVSRTRKFVIRETGARLRFALIGDLHIGSLYCDAAAIQAFYAHAQERGITQFLCTGDVLDGHGIYKGQEFELRDVGYAAQLARLVEVIPEIGTTIFVTGNHDQSFKSLAGVAVGRGISEGRKDFIFLGEEQADVEIASPAGKYKIRLMHPGGGSAYAISYRTQKIIESLEGGTKPNMLAIGHFHKAEMLPSYRNVCGIQTGTFQRQTPFMSRRGLAANIGGWIIEINIGKNYHGVRAEFIACY